MRVAVIIPGQPRALVKCLLWNYTFYTRHLTMFDKRELDMYRWVGPSLQKEESLEFDFYYEITNHLSCKYNHLFEILDYKLSPPTSVIDNVRNLDGKDSIFIEDVDKFKKIIHDFYDDKNEPRISLKNVTIHDQKEFDATESKQVSHKYNVHWMVHNALEGIKNTVGEDYYHCIIKSRSDMILSPNYRFTEILKLTCTRIVGTHKVLFTDWMQSSIRHLPGRLNQYLHHCEDSCFGGSAPSMFLMYENFLEKVRNIESYHQLMLEKYDIYYNTDLNSVPIDLFMASTKSYEEAAQGPEWRRGGRETGHTMHTTPISFCIMRYNYKYSTEKYNEAIKNFNGENFVIAEYDKLCKSFQHMLENYLATDNGIRKERMYNLLKFFIYFLNENDFDAVKYLLDDDCVIKINNTKVSINHLKETMEVYDMYLTGIDITSELDSVSGTITIDDTYKIIMNVNIGRNILSISSVEITDATVT